MVRPPTLPRAQGIRTPRACGMGPQWAVARSSCPCSSKMETSSALQKRAALLTTTSNTDWRSVGEVLMILKISEVAASCSRASLASRCACASRHSRSVAVSCAIAAVSCPVRLVAEDLKFYASLGNGSMALGSRSGHRSLVHTPHHYLVAVWHPWKGRRGHGSQAWPDLGKDACPRQTKWGWLGRGGAVSDRNQRASAGNRSHIPRRARLP